VNEVKIYKSYSLILREKNLRSEFLDLVPLSLLYYCIPFMLFYLQLLFQSFCMLKGTKIENFFGSDFEFCTISLLVMFKY
jgi:hypothetical protein